MPCLFEKSDNTTGAGKLDASNNLKVAVESASLPTGAATEATLAVLLLALSQPTKHKIVTPHNSDPVTDVTKGVQIGVGGTITYQLSGDSATAVQTVVDGQYIPGVFILVTATGTSAAGIVGFGG